MIHQVREHCRGLLSSVVGIPDGGYAGLAAGAGAGWMKEEFELLGVAFEDRGRLTTSAGRAAVVARHGPRGAPSRRRHRPGMGRPHRPLARFWLAGSPRTYCTASSSARFIALVAVGLRLCQ